jgi:hypothetical protein
MNERHEFMAAQEGDGCVSISKTVLWHPFAVNHIGIC